MGGGFVAAVAKVDPAKYAGRGGVARNDDLRAAWRLAPGAPFFTHGAPPEVGQTPQRPALAQSMIDYLVILPSRPSRSIPVRFDS